MNEYKKEVLSEADKSGDETKYTRVMDGSTIWTTHFKGGIASFGPTMVVWPEIPLPKPQKLEDTVESSYLSAETKKD